MEPTLALKKNADLNLGAIEYDEPEESEDEETPEEPSIVKAAFKKEATGAQNPEKDDFDYENIPDWDDLGEEEAPKKAK